MLKRITLTVSIIMLFISCKQDKELLVLKNLPKGENIPVAIKREQLKSVSNKIPVFYFLDKAIPAQADDFDDDGKWDEMALSISTQKRGDLVLSIQWVEEMPDFPIRTNIRMGISEKRDYNFIDVSATVRPDGHIKEDPPRLYQMEGPAWENDKVGFRSYFDTRNGKDIFGKLVNEMVLDSVGLKHRNYHSLSDWGMDVLKVGNSLGAGALALKYKDSLYRLDKTKRESFKIITEGAVRSIFEMHYEGWEVNDLNLALTERITIWAGRNGYQSDVTIRGANGPLELVTGIVNLHSSTLNTREVNDYTYWATHDKQSERKDGLGMAIFTQSKNLLLTAMAPKEGPGITNTYYGILNCEVNKSVTFWFICAWEMADKQYIDKLNFFKMLQNEIMTINYVL